MATNLELRSTYLYADRMGLSSIQPQLFSSQDLYPNVTYAESRPTLKNKYTVASNVSKTICDHLGEELSNMTSSYCRKKMASLIHSLNSNADGIALNQIGKDLVDFDLNFDHLFKERVNAKICVKPGSHKGHVIVHIPAFTPSKDLSIPDEATNFKIEARLITVSDFKEVDGTYEMTSPENHGKDGSYQTPMLPALRTSTQPITSQIRLMNLDPMDTNMSSVLILAIKFYKYKNRRFIHMKEEGAVSIQKVF